MFLGILRGVAVAALLSICVAGAERAARAADDDSKNKIDCADTDLGFNAQGYTVTCSDLSQSTVSLDHDLAGAKVKKLFAIDVSAGISFVTAVDMSVSGVRVYIKRRSLYDEISDNFKIDISDWQGGDRVDGFDAAEFTGRFESGARLDCVGFYREVDRAYEGVGRKVYGLACSSNGHDQAKEMLSHLKAPGA